MIKLIPDFLTAEECQLLIQMSQDYPRRKSKLVLDKVLNEDYLRANQIFPSEGSDLAALIQDLVQRVGRKISEVFNIRTLEHGELTKFYEYLTGGFILPHSDSQDVAIHGSVGLAHQYARRDFAAMLYLNDDFEGGELKFIHDLVTYNNGCISPKRGDLLMFKCNWEFDHEVLPVTSGTRYCIVNWYHAIPRLIPEEETVPEQYLDIYRPDAVITHGSKPEQSQQTP